MQSKSILKNTTTTYGLLSKWLHGLLALLVLFLIGLGWYMVGLSYYDSKALTFLEWHKSFGMLVGFLLALKIIWHIFSPYPAIQNSLSRFESASSRIMHTSLFASMLLMVVSGYLISSSQGKGISIFDRFEFPAFFTVSEAYRDLAINIHFYLAYILLLMVAVHVLAVLKHQIFDATKPLKRMF